MELGPNQTKWLEALESGEFPQGRSTLKKNGMYCCLGVACELFKTDATVIVVEDRGRTRFDDCTGIAPEFAVAALALRDDVGTPQHGPSDLAYLNDTGSSFAEIAHLIRSDPANFFLASL